MASMLSCLSFKQKDINRMDILKNISKVTLALAGVVTVLLLILLATLLSQSGIIVGSFFEQKSNASINTKNNQILIETNITKNQSENAQQFLNMLGLNTRDIQNMGLNFDQQT